jgi:hypothetical protein
LDISGNKTGKVIKTVSEEVIPEGIFSEYKIVDISQRTISRNKITKGEAILVDISRRISKWTELAIGMDKTGFTSRSFYEFHFQGLDEDKQSFNYLISVFEDTSFSSDNLTRIVVNFFQKMRDIQKQFNFDYVYLHHFRYILLDNAGANLGDAEGKFYTHSRIVYEIERRKKKRIYSFI